MTEESFRRSQALYKDISPEEYKRRVAIFPFENLSEDKDVMKHVLPLLEERIEKKGMTVVDQESLIYFLCSKRIRDTGYISGDLARTIKEEFYASKILTGSIISFADEENPRFGILARLIDASEGTIIWADYAVATGEDFITILNLGRLNTVSRVMPRVMDMLFASFVVEALPGEANTSHRIGVMPFKNNSGFKNAGIIAMQMFVIELLKSREFKPVEYGNMRDEIIRLRIWSKGELNYQNINTLSHQLDARGIVVGVVDNYVNGTDLDSPPLVGITVRLLNGRDNKILWYNSDQSSGDQNLIALDWGRMRSVHAVAYGVVSNLVDRMGKVKWQ
jgi:TolB-like protein